GAAAAHDRQLRFAGAVDRAGGRQRDRGGDRLSVQRRAWRRRELCRRQPRQPYIAVGGYRPPPRRPHRPRSRSQPL
nr:hypothetical protein [Tanacetum cinerariifolium]